MEFVNLTPHSINIIDGKTFQPSGIIARVASETKLVSVIDGIRITETVYGKPGVECGNDWTKPLPDPQDDVAYIVSLMLASACPDRADFYVPNESVRDSSGKVVGCKSLSRNPYYRNVPAV